MLNGGISELLQGALERRSDLDSLLEGYRLSTGSEGKSPATVSIVEDSVRYLMEFLSANGLPTNIETIGMQQIRHFILNLQSRPRFVHHPFTKPQQSRLSGHTVNGYVRALRAFWSWAERGGFVEDNPFSHINILKAPRKIMPTFSPDQLRQIVGAVDTRTPSGYRDYTVILTLADTGIRCSELTGLSIEDINLEARLFKVWGKGAKERVVPFGAKVQGALWKYLTRYRQYGPIYTHRDTSIPAFHLFC